MLQKLLRYSSIVFCLISGLIHAAIATPVTTSIPKPFFFTENKGQWDARVLYKCQAKNGMTWFLERDGITLLISREQRTGDGEQGEQPVRRTFLSDDVMDENLPEMMRRHSARESSPMKSHALKFHFVKGNREQAIGNGYDVRDLFRDSRTTGGISSFPIPHCPTPNTIFAVAKSVEANGELPWKNNYFLGNDSSKWAPNCRNFSSVVYREVWDGIDIEWYENDGKLEFDFVVHPGFDPSQIRMSVEGLEGNRISGFVDRESLLSLRERPAPKQSHLDNREQAMGNGNNVRDMVPDSRTTGGISSRAPSPESRTPIAQSPLPITELLLPTSLGELRTALPSVYQVSANGTRNEIEAAFELTGQNIFGITLPSGHNAENTLRIDPLIYSTFLGGTDDDYGMGIVGDGNGGVIVTGGTGSTNYPVTAGVGQTFLSGFHDCFVTYLNSTGTQLLYSTYLGGSGFDNGYGITSDENGGVIVTGGTHSGNFPRTAGSYRGGTDCFVTHLNSTGSQLLFSVLLGGSADDSSRGDDFGRAIVSDGNGGAFVTGSATSSNFTITVGAYDTSLNGTTNPNYGDCFVAHLSNSGVILYSTYLGGSGCEEGVSITDDRHGGAIVTGWTSSGNFPYTAGVFDTSYNGGAGSGDCFVTHLNSIGSQLIYSTFLGGSSDEWGTNLVQEGNNGVIVSGWTTSNDFPVTEGAFDSSYCDSYDCFISRINATGSQLVSSTYFGESGEDGVTDCVIDLDGCINVIGFTSSTEFPTTTDAYDRSYNGGTYDCFVSKINGTMSQLLYSTYLGSSGYDAANGIVYDGVNSIVLTGWTTSSNFPTTSGAYDTSYNGGTSFGDCFVALLRFDTTDVAPEKEVLSLGFSLSQNYPNPFNSSTAIEYTIPRYGLVKLELFDLLGRKVETIVNTSQNAGVYKAQLDSRVLASGEYFCQLSANGIVQTKKMILMK